MEEKWIYPRQKQFERTLRENASNWFKDKGFKTHPKMPYCLDSWENWKNNIILSEVTEFINDCKNKAEVNGKPYPLHKYLHHGLSSQAMAFNLFGPLITRNDFSPLSNLLKDKFGFDIKIETGVFEYEDRKVFNETGGQPTSIDIVLKDENEKPTVFIECKLVEREFGGCSIFTDGDCPGMNPVNDLKECYLHFIGRKYWDLMTKYGITHLMNNDRICPFTSYYQFFREIIFSIENGGPFILLCDERSAVFEVTPSRGLVPFLRTYLPENLKNAINVLTVQELLSSIKQSGRHNDWVVDFGLKYGI
ncbi:MAG: hypothetical protein WBK94_03240 [Tenuifilaceae bacterium]|jgi:hypothetical protein|nr:hypothetical protein [Clostridiaceae bacterium]